MAKYFIGRFEFKTKGSATEEIRRIKNASVALHQPLTGDDDELIRSLLEMHDDAPTGRFDNIKHIAVGLDVQQGHKAQKAFYVERLDGTKDTFSIALKWYDGMSEDERLRASIGSCCRMATETIRLNHKQRAFPRGLDSVFKCEDTGVMLGWHDAHVDHSGEWPMVRITDEWLRSRVPLSWDFLVEQPLPAKGYRLSDAKAADFVRFHNERAVLKVVHKTHNLSKGSGGYRRSLL